MSNFTDELHGKMHRLLDNDHNNVAIDFNRAQQNLGEIIEFADNEGPVAITNGAQEVVLIPLGIFPTFIRIMGTLHTLENDESFIAQLLKSVINPESMVEMDLSIFGIEADENEKNPLRFPTSTAAKIADLRAAAKNNPEAAKKFEGISADIREYYNTNHEEHSDD